MASSCHGLPRHAAWLGVGGPGARRAYSLCAGRQALWRGSVWRLRGCAIASLPIARQPASFVASSNFKEEKYDLLAGVDKSNIEIVSRILEQAKTATDRWEVLHSIFLTPPAIHDALTVLRRLSNVCVFVSGGYPQAERCRLTMGHVDAISNKNSQLDGGYLGAVAALSVRGNFMFASVTHGDFLGSVLGTGITREKVGDILVQGDNGAQIIVVPEIADYLVTALTQVGNVPVSCAPIPLESLEVQPPKVKVMTSVEASLRVDSLASAGFKVSRSKLVELISGGDVRVNWKEVLKNGLTLKTGDIVSIRGKGRLEIGEIRVTKKGKYSVELIRSL